MVETQFTQIIQNQACIIKSALTAKVITITFEQYRSKLIFCEKT